jgi:hypothetical protein
MRLHDDVRTMYEHSEMGRSDAPAVGPNAYTRALTGATSGIQPRNGAI